MGGFEVSWTWLVGVIIYLIGTTSMALGANLQRYSLTHEEEKPEEERRPKMKQPWVVVGFCLMVMSGIFLSLALVFATQTQLAPLILFIFLSNALFAHFLNKEPFYAKSDGFATFLVCVGVLACVVSAPHNNKYYDTDAMIELMKAASFICFMAGVSGFIIAVWLWKLRVMKQCGGDITSLPKNKMMALQLAFGSLPGALGGLNITLTKSTFSLIIGQINDHGFVGIFISPLLYGLAAVLVGTYVLQMKSTVDGLELCSAMIVISTQAVSEMVTATLGGILYFQDYTQFKAWSATVFCVGNVLALCGVGILAYNRAMDEEAAMAAEAEANAKLTDEDGNKIDDDGNVTVEMNPAIVPQGYQPSGTLSTTIDGVKQIIHDVKHDKDDEAKKKALEEEEEQRKADKAKQEAAAAEALAEKARQDAEAEAADLAAAAKLEEEAKLDPEKKKNSVVDV